jgi:hypothetical protein
MSLVAELRWSIELASREFDLDHKTLRKRLVAADTVAGPDGCYSTPQITAAIFGDLYDQKLRIAKAQAEKLEIANKVRADELYEAEPIYRAFEAIFTAVRQKILASAMTNQEKDDLLRDLKSTGNIRIKSTP